MTALTPRKPVPGLEVPTLAGATWNLAERKPGNSTMIVFYRGLHCPICSNYMRDLDRKLGDFEALGVDDETRYRERSRQRHAARCGGVAVDHSLPANHGTIETRDSAAW